MSSKGIKCYFNTKGIIITDYLLLPKLLFRLDHFIGEYSAKIRPLIIGQVRLTKLGYFVDIRSNLVRVRARVRCYFVVVVVRRTTIERQCTNSGKQVLKHVISGVIKRTANSEGVYRATSALICTRTVRHIEQQRPLNKRRIINKQKALGLLKNVTR